jgi:predicted TIM-barrel fold metal-dependent hydrolase
VIDCSVLHSWASPLDVFAYLPSGWREYASAHMAPAWGRYLAGEAELPPGKPGGTPLALDIAYYNPNGDYLDDAMPADSAPAGSDVALVQRHHLDANGIDLALLCHGSGALVPSHGVARLSVELTRAINDFTIDRWLNVDDRFRGAVLVPTQVPEAAAEEIRRVGGHERMSAVLLGANGLGKPFGHPAYLPIFEAAHEFDLPVVIHAGGDQGMETATSPAAAGAPATYTEFRVLAPQALMTHAASLIGQGVMDRYPSLRFLLLGGSVGWITPFLWRFDTDYKAFRHDVLWLKRFPSEVFHECFFVGTGALEFSAAGDRFSSYLEIDHQLGDVICYASEYPDREFASPGFTASLLPAAWESNVLGENAQRFLGARAHRKRDDPSPTPTALPSGE